MLAAYKELLSFVDWLECGHAGGEPLLLADAALEFRERVREVKEQLFYMPEYRELLLHLFCKFNQTRFSRNYLHDLIEATYIYHRLLKRSIDQSDGAILVQSKRRSTSLKRRLQKAMRVAQANSQLAAKSNKSKLEQLVCAFSRIVVVESAFSYSNTSYLHVLILYYCLVGGSSPSFE